MKVFVLHDESGDIKSVIRLDQDMAEPMRPIVAPGEGETVTEIPAEGIVAELAPLEIHEHYRFDVERGTLVRTEPAEGVE